MAGSLGRRAPPVCRGDGARDSRRTASILASQLPLCRAGRQQLLELHLAVSEEQLLAAVVEAGELLRHERREIHEELRLRHPWAVQ